MTRAGSAAPPAVRRVVVTGAESTGKSTLAAALATHLAAPLALEHARAYAERVARALTEHDVEPIAAGQRASEDAAVARAAGGVVVFDTDLRSTLLFAAHYYGDASVPAWLRAEVAARVPWLYLLCDTDVPWAPDPVRDSAAARPAMQRAFEVSVRASGARVVMLSGGHETRLRVALEAVRHGGA